MTQVPPPSTTAADVWPWCPPCVCGRHDECDPLTYWCQCWACLPNDFEEDP